MIKYPLPLLGFAAYSGTGKTTLLCKLIPLLKAKGIRIGVVKHAHHDFDIDYPGKDSYELRQSGASNIVIASRKRTAIIIEHADEYEEPTLEDVLKHTHTEGLDLILVEGFKLANLPKIELHRKALEKPYLYPNDNNIIAIALDHTLDASDNNSTNIPIQLDLNQPHETVDFIMTNILGNTIQP
jgi:molybdopterin-guanine dinucleotide biosynthesis protein B